MAKLWIAEFKITGNSARYNNMPFGIMPPASTQTVTFTTSTQSQALGKDTTYIRVISDADAYLEFGANPTATVSSTKIMANSPEYFGVSGGDKVAVYDGDS